MSGEPFGEIDLPPGHPVELVSEEDRLWFEDHPGRFLRLRYPTDGDYPGDANAILVFCPATGLRARLPIAIEPDELSEFMSIDQDAALVGVFYHIHSGLAANTKLADGLGRTLKAVLARGRRFDNSEEMGQKLPSAKV